METERNPLDLCRPCGCRVSRVARLHLRAHAPLPDVCRAYHARTPRVRRQGDVIMKWEGNRESDNVEDRRGEGYGGGGGGSPIFGGRSIGIGTIVIALVGGWIFGINPL
eukprot:Opistho-1_new@96324